MSINRKHYLSAIVFIIFATLAFACVVQRQVPVQSEDTRRNSSKDGPVYRKSK